MKLINRYYKYVAIVLVLVFLVSAALLLLKMWEKKHSDFSEVIVENDVVTYGGKEYAKKDGIETFLVLGLDKNNDSDKAESHEGGTVQADFLMLLVFDNDAQKTSAIHINRDTMANVNRLDVGGNKIGTEKKQIALAYNFAYDNKGAKSARNTADSVSDLLCGIKIDHYISLTMDAVTEMNDLVGGVEVTVLDDFTGIDEGLVKGSKVTLKGEQALRYVRTRYGLEDSSNSTRMLRQQQYVEAFADKLVSRVESDEEFIITLAEKMQTYFDYDSTDFRLKGYAEKFDEYEFCGIKEIEGETRHGDEFMEFYPDENSIWEIVLDLFYSPDLAANRRSVSQN